MLIYALTKFHFNGNAFGAVLTAKRPQCLLAKEDTTTFGCLMK